MSGVGGMAQLASAVRAAGGGEERLALGSWSGTGRATSGTASDGGIETVLASVPSSVAAGGNAVDGGSGARGLLCGCSEV